jgi:prephenate dehydrogenase
MAEPAAHSNWLPSGWDGWGAVFTIASGAGAFGGWVATQIYRRGYERGRKDQRREDEAKELRDFKQQILSEIAELKSDRS